MYRTDEIIKLTCVGLSHAHPITGFTANLNQNYNFQTYGAIVIRIIIEAASHAVAHYLHFRHGGDQ